MKITNQVAIITTAVTLSGALVFAASQLCHYASSQPPTTTTILTTSIPAANIPPPWCEGGSGDGFCVMDLPNCVEYVTLLDGATGVMTWYQQDWCTGETAVD